MSYAEDVKLAYELAINLSETHATLALERLYYAQRVLKTLKQMPRLAPSVKPLKLSEIAPQLGEEVEVETEGHPFFTKVKKSIQKIRSKIH